MATAGGGSASKLFATRFANMLENMGEVLRVQLEVWNDGNSPILSLDPPPACLRCSTETADLFSLCHQRRRAEVRHAILSQRHARWTCENGLQLAAVAMDSAGHGTGGGLIAVEHAPSQAPKSPPAEAPGAASGGAPSAPEALTAVAMAKAYENLDPGVLLRPGGGDDTGTRDHSNVATAEGEAPFERKVALLADWAKLVSEQSGMTLEMQFMNEELDARSEEITMLTSVTGRMVRFEDVRQTIIYILNQAYRMLGADAAAVQVTQQKVHETKVRPDSLGSDRLDGKAWHRLSAALRQTLTWSDNRSFHGRPSLLGDPEIKLPDSWQILASGFPSAGPLKGHLALVRFDPHRPYGTNDLRLLRSLVNQVEVTTSNAELYDNLKSFLIATVKSLVHAIEAKDSITSGHSERVNILSMLLGRSLGLNESTLETLRWASLLHDVGKIGMPECILMKPGPLSSEEFDIIRQHPERGYRILSPIQQLDVASRSVRAHHEMVNGDGYPMGIAGDEIPFLARIISVADTYDALTQTRPYRKGRSIATAMDEIRRVRGTQLDPEVLDTLERLVPFLEENKIMIDAVSRAA